MGRIDDLAREQEQRCEKKPVIVRLSDVEPQEVRWLWKPYIPLGKLTILEGDPGVGKTWLALQIAAILSTGRPFPCANCVPNVWHEPSNVVYLTAEDGLADTLRPRLDKAGADVSKVNALTAYRNGEENNCVTLKDVDVIDTTLQQVKPALVVIDPLQAYLGAGVDMHRANEVRPVLAGLAALAEKYRCAVLCIRHLGKGQKDRAVYRGLGSIDFSAAARSVLLVGEDPNDESKKVLAHSKSSLAPKGVSLSFELRSDKLFWCGTSDLSADALLAPPKGEEEKSAFEEAGDFLKQVLTNGPKPAYEVLREAEGLGISERTLKRAKAAIGVVSIKDGELRAWRWHPPGVATGKQDSQEEISKHLP
jgi:hypothetical protein